MEIQLGKYFFPYLHGKCGAYLLPPIQSQSSVGPKYLWQHQAFVVRVERIWDQFILKEKQKTVMLDIIFK